LCILRVRLGRATFLLPYFNLNLLKLNNRITFGKLDLSQKYEYISENGKYIGVREYYNYFINLYLIEDVFYELWFFRPTNKIEKIEILDDQKKLDLYINYMN
jgi:hypothetical protein